MTVFFRHPDAAGLVKLHGFKGTYKIRAGDTTTIAVFDRDRMLTVPQPR